MASLSHNVERILPLCYHVSKNWEFLKGVNIVLEKLFGYEGMLLACSILDGEGLQDTHGLESMHARRQGL